MEEEKLNTLLDYWFVFENKNIGVNDDLRDFLKNNDFSDIVRNSEFFYEIVVLGRLGNNKIYNNSYISKKILKYFGIFEDVGEMKK
ncbi:hypothetical protein [Acinetobacter sp. ESBL14]|uniref:hypothetical protein n=1 Tax=Acinetobacter sp. ESBL14 TaxID=3077329 RepID=UPI002FC96530